MLAEQMTWVEYKERVKNSVMILPVGSMEQHGYALPLGVDVIISKALAVKVAEKVDGVVLPSITYGYKSQPTSGGGQLFSGTTSLDGNTLVQFTHDILRDTYRHGGRKFLILNGHYENNAFLTEAVDLFYREDVKEKTSLVILEWWNQVSPELTEELFREAGFPGWDTEHAGITETALMMEFAPDLVRWDKIRDDQSDRKPTYSIFPTPPDIIPASGALYKASYASPEKGKKLADEVVNNIVEIVKKEL